MVSSRSLLGLAVLAMLVGCGTRPAPGIARGQALYDGCLSCHGVDGSGNQAVGAPAIAGLPQWYVEAQLTKFKGGIRGWHPDDTNGLKMRPMMLTLVDEDDLKSVAQYVSGLAPVNNKVSSVEGDAAVGKASYAVCGACHGVDGKGNELIKAPPLANASDWYLLGQLEKFKGGLRGTHPKDTSGAQMRAAVGVLPDETAMKNVVAYIDTLHN